MGCCQFVVRSSSGAPQRRCADEPHDACALRPVSSFFQGLSCDSPTGRCLRGLPPRTPTSTAVPPTQTPTATLTPTATPTATVSRGCCQLDQSSVGHPVCGNQITESSCRHDFDGTPSFCADCVCNSHAGPGFDSDSGTCVHLTPTSTPTPTGPVGCCQLDDVHRAHLPVCGNRISQASCLHDFAGTPSFCADCVCTSHPEPGFLSGFGVCARPTVIPTQTPTATRTPTAVPPPGCCQLNSPTGLGHAVCGNSIAVDTCLEAFHDQAPSFCPDCRCSSHDGSGFDVGPGLCVPLHHPGPHAPHRPRH